MNSISDPRLSRRSFLTAFAAGTTALLLPRAALRAEDAFQLPGATRAALAESPLIYVSPLRSDGAESHCHGEVWFVQDDADLLIATSSEGWRARALRRGLAAARVWVGDFGQWKRSDGRYKTGPSFVAQARFDADAQVAERALEAYGKKYPGEWGKWEPRFRQGLAEGSRVLIRYQPSGA